MTTTATSPIGSTARDFRRTRPHRHLLFVRLVAGLPLLGIGLAHVLVTEAPMLPLVEAAGFPSPSIVAPLGVAAEIVAGLSLLLGVWARIGGLITIPVMLGAIYAHLVIGVWPNGAENEPPLALPIVVAIAAAYIVVRGAGRWSFDRRSGTRDEP